MRRNRPGGGGPSVVGTVFRAAGWWTADYSYAVRWQVRAFFTRADAGGFSQGERAPVLIIPGIYESWKFMLPLVTAIHELGHPIHVISSLKLNLRPVPEAADLVAEYLEAHDLEDVIIVAHSKGGLIGKHVMIRAQGEQRVDRMLAIATPFRGSVYSLFMITPSLRIFSPRDATIRALAAEEAINSRVVSVYGRFDPHIPATSELVGAKNVELDTGGHFRILSKSEVRDEFVAMVQAREE